MRSLFIFLFACVAILPCMAQNYDPLTLAQKIFSKDTLPDIKKYVTGEYEGHPNGSDIKSGLKMSFTLLGQTDQIAVVNITLSDSTGKEFDTYLHFKKATVWKACAFRALALTGMIEKVHEDMASLTPMQVDSIIASPRNGDRDLRMFKSKEEYQFELGNTGLTLASDKELIAHFNKNKTSFEDIRNQLMAKGILITKERLSNMKGAEGIKTQVKSLFIDDVLPDFEGTKKSLDFLIGGITDNAVGYFYIKDPKDVPKMSPNQLIMIRDLGDGWYLYKTT